MRELDPDQINQIDRIANFLANRFRGFGNLDYGDIRQYVWMYALEVIRGWDGCGDMGEMVMVQVYGKLLNLKTKSLNLNRRCNRCSPEETCLDCHMRRTAANPSAMEFDGYSTFLSPVRSAIYNEFAALIDGLDYVSACRIVGLEPTPLEDERPYEQTCNKCHRKQDIDDFQRDRGDRHKTICRGCTADYKRAWRKGEEAVRMKAKTSQYRGVSWIAEKGKWFVQITKKGHERLCGYFVDELEAARAYDRWALQMRGDKAKLNFSNED